MNILKPALKIALVVGALLTTQAQAERRTVGGVTFGPSPLCKTNKAVQLTYEEAKVHFEWLVGCLPRMEAYRQLENDRVLYLIFGVKNSNGSEFAYMIHTPKDATTSCQIFNYYDFDFCEAEKPKDPAQGG